MILHPRTIKVLQSSLIGLSLIFITSIIIEYQHPYKLEPEAINNNDPNGVREHDSISDRISNIEIFNAIIERPLFSVTRRPVEPMAKQDTNISTPEINNNSRNNNEDFLLSGIMITENERIAFIVSARGKTTTKLKIGEEIDGWTITEIASHTVSISRGSDRKFLELEVQKSPAVTTNRQVQRTIRASQTGNIALTDTPDIAGKSNTKDIESQKTGLLPQGIIMPPQQRGELPSQIRAVPRSGTRVRNSTITEP